MEYSRFLWRKEMNELLPCPFCGDPMEYMASSLPTVSLVCHVNVKAKCPLNTPLSTNQTLWNTRRASTGVEMVSKEAAAKVAESPFGIDESTDYTRGKLDRSHEIARAIRALPTIGGARE